MVDETARMISKDYETGIWWVITVFGGCGAFLYWGSETEAEEMCAHKANWEHAIARKRVATVDDMKAGMARHNKEESR